MFGLPDSNLPGLSQILPKMADEAVQRDWTGNSGYPLLQQTISFVQSVRESYSTILGRTLDDISMLDFGCGYGRFIRLMYYFTSPTNIWGVDPWDRAIEICRRDKVVANLAVSDYLPTALPVGDTNFDLIYAYSVFSHLSERATQRALRTLRDYVSSNGLCVITIRPKKYWDAALPAGHNVERDTRILEHEQKGFTFAPHIRDKVDGDITYGDTSFSLDWLDEHASEWRRIDGESMLAEPLQLIVYLRPK